MKKLLYITNIPSPYRVEFWNELSKHYEVTVWFEAQNEKNREWKILGLGDNFKYEFLNGFTVGIDKHLNFEVIKKLSKEKFDVYILGAYSSMTEMLAILWFKTNGKKVFLNSDGGFPKEENIIKKIIKNFFISSASYWLSSGNNCTKYLKFYGAKEKLIFEYPFASINVDNKEYEDIEKQHFIKENNLKGKIILFVGQFIYRKGIDVLLKAFAQLDQEKVSLVLVGGGPEEAKYMDFIEQNQVRNVLILPFMQRRDLMNYYKNADVFVLPTREDIWGLVLNEAMNFDLPIISTDKCGASYDLIENGVNGFIVSSEDEKELAEKLKILLTNENMMKTFGIRSKEIISNYTIEKMVQAHVEAIERVEN